MKRLAADLAKDLALTLALTLACAGMIAASADSIFASTEPVTVAPGCVPRFENGETAGYDCSVTTTPPPEGGAYDRLELRTGDVIRSVNGKELNDPQNALEALNPFSVPPEPVQQNQADRRGEADAVSVEQPRAYVE